MPVVPSGLFNGAEAMVFTKNSRLALGTDDIAIIVLFPGLLPSQIRAPSKEIVGNRSRLRVVGFVQHPALQFCASKPPILGRSSSEIPWTVRRNRAESKWGLGQT